MGWLDNGHSAPAPRGETVEIKAHSIGEVFRNFGVLQLPDPSPPGMITTTHPNNPPPRQEK